MTHPDDEISICILIHRLVQNGNYVSVSWTHSCELREKESRSVMEFLGVSENHLDFIEGTDGRICDEIKRHLPIFKDLAKMRNPDVVVCGAFEQGHLDHDATNYLVHQSFNCQILETPFYHAYDVFPLKYQVFNRFSRDAGVERVSLTKNEQRLKKQIAKMYKSQNIWQLLLGYEISQIIQFKKPDLCRREFLREANHKDFISPNHDPALAKKIVNTHSWQRWMSSMNNLTNR
jgi:LmbE family N-acetylglucosaminyl deacetylase